MHKRLIVISAAALLITSGCTTQQVQQKEDLLAASGFTVVPANTPERQAALKKLPPHKFSRQNRNNAVVYVYPDPTVCGCLYVGSQAAYSSYREKVFTKQIADEQAMTAEMYQMDWGPWPAYYY